MMIVAAYFYSFTFLLFFPSSSLLSSRAQPRHLIQLLPGTWI